MPENFPRGGSDKKGKLKRKEAKIVKAEKDLFATKSAEPASKKAKKDNVKSSAKKQSKKSKQKRTPDGSGVGVSETQFVSNVAKVDTLSLKSIPYGMLLLGVVKEIQDYQLVLSIPNGSTATVQITHISDAYKALLQKVSEGDLTLLEKGEILCPLEGLFRVGQLLRCKALDIVNGKKARLKVTINPTEVNQGIQAVSLKSGMVLSGSVSSQEDHGFVIDIGVPGVSAFLTNKLADKFVKETESEPLKIGRYLDCMVLPTSKVEDLVTRNSRIVNVTVTPRKVYRSVITDNMKFTISMLKPGMVVEGTVDKVTDSGLVVKFIKYKGTIHRSHLLEALTTYNVQDKIKVAVLYINPTTKAVSLTQLVHLVTPDLAPRKLFGDFVYGDVVEETEVWRFDKKRGVSVNLSERVAGFARMSALSDKEVPDAHQKFKRGTKHTCRIVDFDYCDGVAKVSFKESVIKQQYLKYGDIQPGQMVTCEVKKFHDKGMSVKLADQIQGFIPTMHLSDVPLRHPEKKFKDNKPIKCRVLTVVPEHKKLILTNKKTLVKTKYPIITSYSQCEPGTVLEGFIADVKDSGVLVVFYNDVKGFVPKSELSTEEIEYPRQLFFEGQVVKCVVLSCDPHQNRLRLSLKVSGRTPFASKTLDLPAGLDIGQMTSCKITKKSAGGLDVLLQPHNVEAFLPTSHLTDHMTLCDLLYDMYREGEELPEVMVLSKTNVLVVTNKLSLIKAEKEGLMVKQFSDLKAGLLVPGTVKKIMSYGFFVELCNKLVGLVPTKYICDSHPVNPLTLFSQGQSVKVKVTEVDSEKERFLLSTRMSDCYHGDTDQSQDILEDYLTQYKMIVENLAKKTGQLSKLASLTLGEMYKVKVTNVSNHGITCELENGVKGIVTEQNMTGVQCKVGDSLEAVLLYIDPVNKCVEMSLSHDLIKAIKHLQNNKFTEAKVDQVVKSEVHLVKPDFVLTVLKGHTAGRLAFLPAKKRLISPNKRTLRRNKTKKAVDQISVSRDIRGVKHHGEHQGMIQAKLYNDVLEHRQFCVGQTNSVVIKRATESFIFTGMKMYESEGEALKTESSNQYRHKLQLGDIVDAVVKHVYEHQLNIHIVNTPGRVHNTEIADNVPEGTDPLKKFKAGDNIKVKVIGFRDVKNHKFLPISHPNLSRSIPECTMRESALAVEGPQPCENPEERKLKVGDKVQAFMSNYSHKCLWMQITAAIKGKVYVLNASDDLEMLKDPALHFKTGQCYSATVIGVEKGKPLQLSLTGVPTEVKKNAVVKGFIVSKSERSGLSVKLSDGYRGTVALCDITDDYHEQPLGGFTLDQVVKCAVIGYNTQQKHKCLLSLRMSRVCPCKETRRKVVDREIKSIKDLKEGEVTRGYVTNCDNFGVFVSLGRDLTGRVHYDKVSEYYISEPSKVFTPGTLVTVKVLRVHTESCKVDLSLLEADTGVKLDITTCHQTSRRLTEKQKAERPPRKRKVSEPYKESSDSSNDDKSKKGKAERKDSVTMETEENDSGVEMKEIESETKHSKSSAVSEPVSLSSTFSWENTFSLPKGLSESESESEDDKLQGETTKKHKTRQEKKVELKLEEQKLYQREKQLLDSHRTPETEDDFNRLVLKSPDSSLVWLRYMAHHLQTSEVDKARSVAERALETISFREEQEKLNIWVAYMNLENMYGTHESLLQLFDRAVKHNEPLSVYQQLVSIYIKSSKSEAAEQLYNTMVKKFGQDKDVWVNFGLFYFKDNKPDLARKLLQRSFKTLEKKQQVDVIAKYAQLEFKYGEPEKGKTMFENLVMSYSKRTDLWSVYIDLMVKSGDTEAARQLFERLIHLSLSAKKMKFCFKKYLDFEQKWGTEDKVMAVKQKAIEYVEGRADE